MSIVLGIITFIVFYVDMIWMNCIYPEMQKGKKDPKEIEAESRFSSFTCIIVLAIVVAIVYFAELSQIVLFVSIASLIMCGVKYLSFTKFFKRFKTEETDYFSDDCEDRWFSEDYDEYRVPGNIFQEYDDEYEEDEEATFEQYNGKDADFYIEVFEEDIDEDEFIDIIDGKHYI